MIDASPVARAEVEAALRRAHAFVSAHGDDLERVRVEIALGLCAWGDAVVVIEPRVVEAGDPRRAAALLLALAELRLLRSAVAQPFVSICESLQRMDGSWSVTDSASIDLLPAFTAGESDPVVLTATIAACLAHSGAARRGTVDAAGHWVASRWSADLAQAADAHGLAALFHFFAAVDHDLSDEALQWCGRELERGFRTQTIDAVDVARVFTRCEATALPGARMSRFEIVRALLATQRADGGWSRAPAQPSDAATTAHASIALMPLAGLRPPVLVVR